MNDKNKSDRKKQYFELIVLILANLKKTENYKKIYAYSQELLMKEYDQKEVSD